MLLDIRPPEIGIVDLIRTIFDWPTEVTLEIDACICFVAGYPKRVGKASASYMCVKHGTKRLTGNRDAPVMRPVSELITIVMSLALICPSFVTSSKILGAVDSSGKVYRCKAVRRVDVSSSLIILERLVEK